MKPMPWFPHRGALTRPNIRCLLLAVALFHAAAGAQIATYTTHRARTSPRVDGLLDDPAWQDAARITGFRLLGAENGTTAHDLPRTSAMITYDADALYIAFDCQEPLSHSLVTTASEHDGKTWLDDGVEIFLDPSGKRGQYVQLAINTAGVIMDGLISAPGARLDLSHDTGAHCRTVIREGNWTMEIRIPFDGLPLADPTADWTVHLARNRRAANQLLTSLQSRVTGFHDIAAFDILRGIALPERPVSVLEMSPGECFIGLNSARITLRNWGREPERVSLIARLDAASTAPREVTREVQLAPGDASTCTLQWPWKADEQQAVLTLQAISGERNLATRTVTLGEQPSLFADPQHTVFYLYRHAPVDIRLPVRVATESRKNLTLHWQVSNAQAQTVGAGMTSVRSPEALIRLFWQQWVGGAYTLHLTLQQDNQDLATTEFPIRLLENPWSH